MVPDRDNAFVQAIAMAISAERSRFQLRDRPARRPMPMAVSALKSNSDLADDGKLACYTR